MNPARSRTEHIDETVPLIASARERARSTRSRPSILFINQYYYPDDSATSQLLQQLAEDLAQRGFRVAVLTGGAHCEGGKIGGPRRERYRGVQIVRTCSLGFTKRRLIGQALNYLSFHLLALLGILLLPRFDVVVTLTTPPLIGWLGGLARLVKGSRFVYWVQDLYPDVAVALGTLSRSSRLFGFCSAVSRFALRSADRVVALGDVMAETLVEAGACSDTVRVLENWADGSEFGPAAPAGNSFVRAQALQGKTVVLYSGNFGRAHVFEDLLAAAADLESEPEVEIVMLGSGYQTQRLVDEVQRRKLTRVRILPPVPRDQLPDVLCSASIGVVTQNPKTTGLLVPSKLYGLMAAGRPVLFIGPEDADVARIVRAAGCGFVVSPGDTAGVVSAIREVRDDPAEAAHKGQLGRAWFLAHDTRLRAVDRFGSLLTELAGCSASRHRRAAAPALAPLHVKHRAPAA